MFSHNFNNFQGMADIRSLSKTVLTLVAGILMDIDKNFNLETKVYPIIKGALNLENKDNLA